MTTKPEYGSKEESWARLESLGWRFYQYGPSDFGWFKFDRNGYLIARGGDGIWDADLKQLNISVSSRTPAIFFWGK